MKKYLIFIPFALLMLMACGDKKPQESVENTEMQQEIEAIEKLTQEVDNSVAEIDTIAAKLEEALKDIEP